MANLAGLVKDPRFQRLSAKDKRTALERIGAPSGFIQRYMTEFVGADPSLEGVVSDEPGGGWDQARADYEADRPDTTVPPNAFYGPRITEDVVQHPMAQFGYGAVRGLGNVARGAVSLLTPPHLSAMGVEGLPADRIEEMLPQDQHTGASKLGEVTGAMAATMPLALAGGPGMGAASALGRIGVEGARGAAIGAMSSPDNMGAGATMGGLLGGGFQGVGEGLRQLGPMAIQAMKRLYGAEGALPDAPLPGTTADAIGESLLNTPGLTRKTLAANAQAANAQAGADIMTTVNQTPGQIPVEELLPQSQRVQLAIRSMNSTDPLVTELASGVRPTYTPGEAQVLKQHMSELGRAPNVDPALGELYREAAGRSAQTLRGAVPGYDDLMQRAQLAQSTAGAAAQGPNRLASQIASGAMAGVVGGAGHAAGIPPYVLWPSMYAAGVGRGRDLGSAGLIAGIKATNLLGNYGSEVPWGQMGQVAESAVPTWYTEDQP